MKQFLRSNFIVCLLGLVCLASVGMVAFALTNRPEKVEIVEVPASTEDRFTGERDGKWFIDGQEVDEKRYLAYMEMMAGEDNVTTEALTEQLLASAEKSTEEASTRQTTTRSTNTATGRTQTNTGSATNTTTTRPNTGATASTSGSGNGNSTTGRTQTNTGSQPTTRQPSTRQPSTPACSHNWVEVMQTVHHDAQYETVVIEAVYARYRCHECGGYCYDIHAHVQSTSCTGGTWTNVAYGTHVITPERREQRLVRDAYDEQVGTGIYKCSKCGAVK